MNFASTLLVLTAMCVVLDGKQRECFTRRRGLPKSCASWEKNDEEAPLSRIGWEHLDVRRNILLLLNYERSAERHFAETMAAEAVKLLWLGRNHGRVMLAGGWTEPWAGRAADFRYYRYYQHSADFNDSRCVQKEGLLRAIDKCAALLSYLTLCIPYSTLPYDMYYTVYMS